MKKKNLVTILINAEKTFDETRYPFYSKKDTKRFMLYAYSLLYDDNSKEYKKLWDRLLEKF